MRHVLLIVALFGALFAFRLGDMSVVDYDEAAYAEVAREMLLRGDALRPHLDGEPWYEKPPLLYWGMLTGFWAVGVNALGVRLVNALAGVALLLVVYGFARRPLGTRGALASALVLGTSLEVIGLARVALTDLELTVFLIACLGCLHRALEAQREGGSGVGWYVAACACSGLAMLSKGLIGLLLPGGAALLVALYERRLGALFRPVCLALGLPVLLGVGLSWYVALGAADGFGFMRELFWEHHVGRFLSPKHSHGGPIVFYLPVLLLGFLPWSPLVPLAVARAGLRGDDERARFLRLMSAFAALTFLFFSLAATKLPNYVAPCFPPLALLVGDLLARDAARARAGDLAWRRSLAAAAGLYLALAVALLATPFVLPFLPELLPAKAVARTPGLSRPLELGPWPVLLALILAGAGGLALSCARRGEARRAAVALGGGLALLLLAAAIGPIPRYEAHFRAPLHELAREAAPRVPEDERLVLVGLRHVPSVTFYGGRLTRYVSPSNALEIAALFEGAVGLTSEGFIDAVDGPGRREILAERGGYVLFRCAPAISPPASSEPR